VTVVVASAAVIVPVSGRMALPTSAAAARAVTEPTSVPVGCPKIEM
jgi:hypothetical protein